MKKMNKERTIIINADDFGLSIGINKGIVEAYKNGILTSTSICANGDSYDDAVKLAKENSGLDIGIHLVLVGEKPLADPNKIKSLLDENGNFHNSAAEFTKRYFLGKINLEEVRLELSLQFLKVINSGIKISHIDSHQHVHSLSKIYLIVKEFAEKHSISFIRNPSERVNFYMLKSLKNFPRVLQQLVLGLISSFSIKNSRYDGLNRFAGFFYGGNLTKENLKKILLNIPVGQSCEIMCHPAYFAQNSKYKFWNYNHEKELAALVDKEIIDLVSKSNMRVTNFTSL